MSTTRKSLVWLKQMRMVFFIGTPGLSHPVAGAFVLAVVLAAADESRAVQIIPAEIVNPSVTSYDNLPFSTFVSTPVAIGDATYNGPQGRILYVPSSTNCVSGGCIGRYNVGDTPGSEWVDVTLDSPTSAVGVWVETIEPTSQVQVEFFDPTDVLLTSMNVSSGFIGWGDLNGIGRMRVTDIVNDGRIFFLDDFTIGTLIPEPSTALLLSLGLVALARRDTPSGSRSRRAFRSVPVN